MAIVIPHMYTGDHDKLLHITSMLIQPLHFKAVMEPAVSDFFFESALKVKRSTEINEREDEQKKQ
jgi:hypothetical protein